MSKIVIVGATLAFLAVWVAGTPVSALPQSTTKKNLESDQVKDVKDTKAKKAPDAEAQSGPILVFADIEAGWNKEQVEQILQHYGKGKVAIAIEGSGPTGGKFSRNQSYYLLKDLFTYTITEKFEFVQYRHVTDGRDDVYAVAERKYKRNDDGRTFKDKIYVSLHLEDDRWVISEIKSIR
jgi:hypothetical protein